jgi:L-alanine-DL-glutamate epimerase-like enolase superfamily enzyme
MSVGSRRSERRNRIFWNYGRADPRITEIKISRFDLPLTSNLRIATMNMEKAKNVLVQIISNEGMGGWGETSPMRSITRHRSRREALRQLHLSRNSLEISALFDRMARYLPHHATIRSAFDMVPYDIAKRSES